MNSRWDSIDDQCFHERMQSDPEISTCTCVGSLWSKVTSEEEAVRNQALKIRCHWKLDGAARNEVTMKLRQVDLSIY